MSDGAARGNLPRLVSRNFAVLLLAQACFGYAFSSFFMLPKFLVTRLGAGPLEIGLVTAAYSTATIASIPAMGVLVDHFGRRVFMTGGALAMAALCLGFGAVSEVGPLVYALRAGQGIAFAMVFVGGATLAVDESPPERVGQGIALFGLTMLSMNGVAAACVESIAARASWGHAFAAAAAAALACAVLSRAIVEGAAAERSGRSRRLRDVARRPGLPRLFFAIASVGAAMSSVVTFHQPFALERGIRTVSVYFVAYAAAAMVVRAGMGRWIDRAGRRRVAIASLAVYAVAVPAMVWLSGTAFLVLLGIGVGVAHGFAYPSLNSLAIAGIPASERGKVMALFQGAFHVGFAGAALGLGAVADAVGYPPVFVIGGACALLGLLAVAAPRGVGAGPGPRDAAAPPDP